MACECGAPCGSTFAKVLLIIFDILFLCTGLVLIALGIWILVILDSQIGFKEVFSINSQGNTDIFRASAGILLAMGCCIVLITVLGLIAAIKESAILLGINLALLCLIFAGEITAGVLAIVYKDWILDHLQQNLQNSFDFSSQAYYNDTTICKSQGSGVFWDRVQLWFGCCGLYDSSEAMNNGYNMNKFKACTRPSGPTVNFPLTCCYVPDHSLTAMWNFNYNSQWNSTENFNNCSSPDPQGCADKISDFIANYSPILIGIGIGFGMLELFGIIFIVCLCKNPTKGFQQF